MTLDALIQKIKDYFWQAEVYQDRPDYIMPRGILISCLTVVSREVTDSSTATKLLRSLAARRFPMVFVESQDASTWLAYFQHIISHSLTEYFEAEDKRMAGEQKRRQKLYE